MVKALALGATGVLVGRVPMMGSALRKSHGVSHVLCSLINDTQCTMINAGVSTVCQIRDGYIDTTVSGDISDTRGISLVRSPNVR